MIWNECFLFFTNAKERVFNFTTDLMPSCHVFNYSFFPYSFYSIWSAKKWNCIKNFLIKKFINLFLYFSLFLMAAYDYVL